MHTAPRRDTTPQQRAPAARHHTRRGACIYHKAHSAYAYIQCQYREMSPVRGLQQPDATLSGVPNCAHTVIYAHSAQMRHDPSTKGSRRKTPHSTGRVYLKAHSAYAYIQCQYREMSPVRGLQQPDATLSGVPNCAHTVIYSTVRVQWKAHSAYENIQCQSRDMSPSKGPTAAPH
jgi:hypothetical protein